MLWVTFLCDCVPQGSGSRAVLLILGLSVMASKAPRSSEEETAGKGPLACVAADAAEPGGGKWLLLDSSAHTGLGM